MTEFACPGGADCNIIYGGGLCQQTCIVTAASSCRGNVGDLLGDYECRAWSNLSIGGVAISKGPVCDFVDSIPCSLFGSSSIDCSYLGDTAASNPTKMGCRKIDNTVLTNPKDPQGFCMDDTASGPGGAPTGDAGAKDAGADSGANDLLIYDWVPWPDTRPAADGGSTKPPTSDDDGGCSCRAAGDGRSGGAGGALPVLALLGLALLLGRRKRRQRDRP